MMETVNIQSPAADATVHFSSDGNNRLFRSSSMTNISLELNSETQRLETPGITAESLIKAHGEVNTAPLLRLTVSMGCRDVNECPPHSLQTVKRYLPPQMQPTQQHFRRFCTAATIVRVY